MSHRILSYLDLNKLGAFELFVALYPILCGYSWGVLHGKMIFIALTAIWALAFKGEIKFSMKWLVALITFVIIHELLLMAVIPIHSYFINNTISILIVSLSILPIARAIDYRKFVGAVNWVAIISIIGIVYQFTMILRGMPVTPLKLPFLPEMESTARLYEESIRPSSFFWEPAAFVTFLMIPLFISLREKKFIWTGVLVLAMFLSTSSTGILMSMVMLIAYIFTQKVKFRTKVLVVLMGVGLFYGLTHSSYFEAGVNKIENTDPEKNARIMNGIFLYEAMSGEDVMFGVPAANIDEFYEEHAGFYFGAGNVFIPTFWLTLAKYGIIGLFLFIMVYISLYKKDKTILPYLLVLFISMYFQSASTVGSSLFAFQLIFLYRFVNRDAVKVFAPKVQLR